MLVGPVLDLLVPHRCVTCAARCSPPWCDGCARTAAALRLDAAAACTLCAGPLPGHSCWIGPSPVDRLAALFDYRGPVADAVVQGKLGGVHAVWRPLGESLAATCADGPPTDVVTWVPAPSRRRRRRGFDQAQLLATVVARCLALPHAPLLRVPRDLPDRGSVEAHDRGGLPAGSYTALRPLRARVLLVDDVVTTGATIAAASAALVAAGARVHAAVVARAGAHRLGALPPDRTG